MAILKPVRKAVLPAAGFGTRFLPVTKAVPKELLPIIDTPALQLIIDEAVGAGCDHIVVVTSHSKPAIEAYFEPAPHVVARLRSAGRPARHAITAGSSSSPASRFSA